MRCTYKHVSSTKPVIQSFISILFFLQLFSSWHWPKWCKLKQFVHEQRTPKNWKLERSFKNIYIGLNGKESMGTERGGLRRSSSSSHGDGNMKITVSNLYFLILTCFFFHYQFLTCALWKFTILFSNDLLITYSNDEHLQTRP